MKRVIILLGLSLFIWGTYKGIKQYNELSRNIDYFNDHAPNLNNKKIAPPVKHKKKQRKKRYVRKIKDPETIFAEADYLVKIRIFKKFVIPVTKQTINVDTEGFGSGFITNDKRICKSNKYCVVTAFHVVDNDMVYFSETKDGSEPQLLELVRGTTTFDFAVLRFVDYKYVPKKVAIIGKSSDLKPGARMHTMGSNLYGDFWFSPSGHLYDKAKRANPRLENDLSKYGMNHPQLLLFHTPIFHGFSGGPLVNKYGEVVGITIGYTKLDEEPIYIGSPIDGIIRTLKEMK